MGRVTCDWCDVLMRGSWEESGPLLLLLMPRWGSRHFQGLHSISQDVAFLVHGFAPCILTNVRPHLALEIGETCPLVPRQTRSLPALWHATDSICPSGSAGHR